MGGKLTSVMYAYRLQDVHFVPAAKRCVDHLFGHTCATSMYLMGRNPMMSCSLRMLWCFSDAGIKRSDDEQHPDYRCVVVVYASNEKFNIVATACLMVASRQ